MKLISSSLLFITCTLVFGQTQQAPGAFPVRGLCIAAPTPQELDAFLAFIDKELAPRQVNTLILRIDFAYQFDSHPELREATSLSKKDVGQLKTRCEKHNIRLIPQINLLGHQSWAGKTNKLLEVYPQFDETPHVKMPEKYAWPNDDGLYCKSYCPLHPEVHKVVFDLVDEICDAFGSDAFHAGMDEVFYLGDEKCPRCSGHDPAELFANEVAKIRDHLASKNRELWIWGDRLLDGRTTGLGMWEASFNNTYRAIERIPRDVVICDWHYERPDKTAVYFAMKGFHVITCPWRNPEVAITQVDDMYNFRKTATPEMRERYLGMLQTVWSDVGSFLEGYYSNKKDEQGGTNTPWHCFKSAFARMVEQPKD